MTDKFTTHVAAFVALRNEKGEYLLQRRKNTGFLDGFYDFAATGHVEISETAPQAAVREAAEEIGVLVDEKDLKLVRIHQGNVDLSYMSFVFVCDSWTGEPSILEPEKCDDLQWFATDAFPEQCTVVVRMCQQDGFPTDLRFTHIDASDFQRIMGFDLVE